MRAGPCSAHIRTVLRLLRWPCYPPIWFLAHLVLLLALQKQTQTPLPDLPLLRTLGTALGGLGLLGSISAIVVVHRARTPVLPFCQPVQLIAAGPFRFSRNPIYLGEAFILTGLVLRGLEWLPFILLPSFILGLTWGAIRWEEAALHQAFGPAYRDYCQRTRRWL